MRLGTVISAEHMLSDEVPGGIVSAPREQAGLKQRVMNPS